MISQSKRLKVYENLMHYINMQASIRMDAEKMQDIIKKICDYSYSYRMGNGQLTDRQQRSLINEAFKKLDIYGVLEE